jgi:diguanylate cyclase (GGDEF)-like protein
MAVNPAAVAMFGYADGAALQGATPLDWSPQQQPDGRLSNAAAESYWAEVYGTGLAAFDWQFRRPDSGALWLGAVQLQMIAAESRQAVIGRVRDITEQRRAEEQIHRLAYRDALTGLPNRPATLEWLQQQLAAAAGPPLLLIKFDLDDFRALNEAFGDQQGDQLLQHVARAFPPRLPAEAWLSRLGSDDFLLVLPLPQDGPALQAAVEASRWVARLQAWLLLPEDVPQSAGLLRCTLSAGLVLHRGGDTTATELLSQAETALRHAKLSGPGSHQLYSEELSRELQRRMALERDREQAIDQERLHLVFQPQFDAQRRIVAAEALLRFTRPSGPVSPEDFIPLAEQNGQIHRLATWMLEAACSQLAEWQALGLELPPLALNISARQFDQAPSLVPLLAQLQELLRRYGLKPQQLVLEITETALLSDGLALQLAIHQLVAHGFRLSIDDFGVGYSSLSILRDIPLSELKIDKTFVQDLVRNSQCRSLVKGLATYARAEGITLVAEGVETEAQFHLLQELQVDHFQGYWCSSPLSAVDFAALLQASAA